MSDLAPPIRARVPNAERSRVTRERLLDATVESLVEVGYAATTTSAVCERAGLSRGAVLHHFPTRADLLVNAVAHLALRRGEEMQVESARRAAAHTPGARSSRRALDSALDFLWAAFSGPLFFAALELWSAARTDRELHRTLYAVERVTGARMAEAWRAIARPDAGQARHFDDLLELSFHLMRGMALQRILRCDDTERRRLYALWKRLVAGSLAQSQRSSP